MGFGSYALSLLEREQLRRGNPSIASAIILKLLGEQGLDRGLDFSELLSLTGLPPDLLKRLLDELIANGLCENRNGTYALTERGEKARFLVAS